jgi:hypothetical protein
MKPFVINRHGQLVFPANFLIDLDFSLLETLDQFAAVISRDFEAKAAARPEPEPVLGQPLLDHYVRQTSDALA